MARLLVLCQPLAEGTYGNAFAEEMSLEGPAFASLQLFSEACPGKSLGQQAEHTAPAMSATCLAPLRNKRQGWKPGGARAAEQLRLGAREPCPILVQGGLGWKREARRVQDGSSMSVAAGSTRHTAPREETGLKTLGPNLHLQFM